MKAIWLNLVSARKAKQAEEKVIKSYWNANWGNLLPLRSYSILHVAPLIFLLFYPYSLGRTIFPSHPGILYHSYQYWKIPFPENPKQKVFRLKKIRSVFKSLANIQDGTLCENRRRTHRSETIFGNWKPFKSDEKCFLFQLKSSFHFSLFKVFQVLSWLFGHIEKRFD